jgi:hypothetical protein
MIKPRKRGLLLFVWKNAKTRSGSLPPKPGRVLTLLDVLPNVDCVFFAHAGLEAFARIKDLSSGEVVGSTVRVRCWRVAAQDIPQTVDERLRWLFAQWGKMNALVRNARETK